MEGRGANTGLCNSATAVLEGRRQAELPTTLQATPEREVERFQTKAVGVVLARVAVAGALASAFTQMGLTVGIQPVEDPVHRKALAQPAEEAGAPLRRGC